MLMARPFDFTKTFLKKLSTVNWNTYLSQNFEKDISTSVSKENKNLLGWVNPPLDFKLVMAASGLSQIFVKSKN